MLTLERRTLRLAETQSFKRNNIEYSRQKSPILNVPMNILEERSSWYRPRCRREVSNLYIQKNIELFTEIRASKQASKRQQVSTFVEFFTCNLALAFEIALLFVVHVMSSAPSSALNAKKMRFQCSNLVKLIQR